MLRHVDDDTPSGRFRLRPVALAVLLSVGSAGLECAQAASIADPPVGAAPAAVEAGSVDEAMEGQAAGPDAGLRHDDQGELRLSDLKSGRSIPPGRDAINPLRAEALKESALAYGARAGLYARMREINRMLDEDAGALDQNFPFAPLILAHNVVPPVIQTGRNTVRKHSDAQLQFADAVYTIVAPAKLAVTPLNWRTYLYVRADRPEPPDETLLPNRSQAAEMALWERSIEAGWLRGVHQADRTFAVQLNRLERDLSGMALYRELLAKNMVTPPRLTEQWRGVTTTGNTLRVNDRRLEIAENPRFVSDNLRWTPYPTTPYSPPKHLPKINVRVLGATPAPPAPSPASPAAIGEKPPWER